MPSQASLKAHSPEERRRVLDAYNSGGDWQAVARHNGFPRTTAQYLVNSGRVENLPRGGARGAKVTPAIKEALESYLNECCSYTLNTMQDLIMDDFQVHLSTSTISRHLLDMLYTVKQARIEPFTCNSRENKEKRKQFAEELVKHHNEGNLVVYFDETNYNLYVKRTRGRAKKGERAVEKLPPSKGANLQIQCAVLSAIGVVAYRTHRSSTKMQTNANFIENLYDVVTESDMYKSEYADKKVVIVFDNAPAHNQTEVLVKPRDDLVLLRLGPYSPMCNPIENCFSVLKSHIKQYLALMREEMLQPGFQTDDEGKKLTKTEARMRLLGRAAHVSMPCITQQLVLKMELHARDFVNAALRMEDMQYGM